MKTEDVINLYKQYVMETYGRIPLVPVKGKGMLLKDLHQREFLDFFPGWAVSGLGHCHPKVVNAVKNQVTKIIHIPNNYYILQQAKLAKEIIDNSFPGKVFFCNSGAEAVEGAIKLARAFGDGERFEIISMEKSFHGRTLAALALTGQKKYQEGFEPMPEGFKCVPFADVEALKKAITTKTCAIFIEPVQGEGGINVAPKEYLEAVRKLCNEKNILLVFDEIQTGMGRTGKIFAYQHFGITPDAFVLAKSLGGGIPIGALVAAEKIAGILKPGMHASTFGGSPIACVAGLAVFKAIKEENLLQNVKEMGDYLRGKLAELKQKYAFIEEIKGLGVMLGIKLSTEGKKIVDLCFERGLLINCTQGNILRIMPALGVKKKEIDRMIKILDKVLTDVEK
ncbi:MAG: aspartate aminotransferase family protein [Candidatus Omnitrophota bacterium]